MNNLKYLAIYLPQFHPIPENDTWWGKGFTEWRNVTKAKPLFRGHYQPRLPSDLGFYDLRVPEVREEQARMAKDHGIDGFCYFHYWFKGRRVLEKPVDEILKNGKPDFPFCLFWANETWEGRWHGIVKERRTLIKQEYSEEDDVNHARWLAIAMADKRYFRIGNRPVFVIYKPLDLPDLNRTIETWRREFKHLGMPNPYLIGSNAGGYADIEDLLRYDMDAALQHIPELGIFDYFHKNCFKKKLERLIKNIKHGSLSRYLHIYDYEYAVRKMLWDAEGPIYRSIIPSWDNSPRAGDMGAIFVNSTPDKFEKILYDLSKKTIEKFPADKQILFLNAWNEWAEGNHLEPDLKYGKRYLEAVKKVKIKCAAYGS
ncbi:MAG: glycoside hydrolase family 99-like domain-containing protein [Candidatus Omnitrophota bacterium]|nr:glycoside hydrolase family 99-like domain-containing protein [Candidatus Omnitrophota bacterium]